MRAVLIFNNTSKPATVSQIRGHLASRGPRHGRDCRGNGVILQRLILQHLRFWDNNRTGIFFKIEGCLDLRDPSCDIRAIADASLTLRT